MQAISEVILKYLPCVLLLVAGFSLVVAEVFIPGFGLPGISGAILLIVGIIVGANNLAEALVMVIIVVALLCAALSIAIHAVSKGRFARSRLVLNEVSNGEIDEADLDFFIGKRGIARTVLRPAGIGEFDGVKLSVVSDGEFIGQDEPIEVARVEGNRIVVLKANT